MAREWNSTSSTTRLLPRVLGSEPATPLSTQTHIEGLCRGESDRIRIHVRGEGGSGGREAGREGMVGGW